MPDVALECISLQANFVRNTTRHSHDLTHISITFYRWPPFISRLLSKCVNWVRTLQASFNLGWMPQHCFVVARRIWVYTLKQKHRHQQRVFVAQLSIVELILSRPTFTTIADAALDLLTTPIYSKEERKVQHVLFFLIFLENMKHKVVTRGTWLLDWHVIEV